MKASRLGPVAITIRPIFRGAASVILTASLAGCASQNVAQHYAHGHEHFSQAKYGHASPKVVADGQAVPHGGGQYLVGHPYTIAGHTYYPGENTSYSVIGMASWYGAAFHGRRTANGEVYDMSSLTAAHPTMPLPSYARVTNLSNGYSVIVRVNDRGPYHGGRVMDVSSRTADVLNFKGAGTARIKVEYVGRAPMEGSDDQTLLASLRTDGSPANLNGYSTPAETMVASSDPAPTPFAALFQSPPSQPAPEPPPPAQPEREAQPVRVAEAEPPADVPEAPPVVALRQPHTPVPLPPPRPFDLGAAQGGAGAVATAPSSRVAQSPQASILPPRRPILQASAEKALYFAEPAPAKRRTAFEKVTPGTGFATRE
jgi:rare lipoprotein A